MKEASYAVTVATWQELTVRPATEADIPGILALIAACDIAQTGQADPWSEDDIRGDWVGKDLERDGWVFEAPGGELVAYGVILERAIDEESERFGLDAYVHPNYTGRGIGSEILRRFEARARELSVDSPAAKRVVLHSGTLASDVAARHLMESQGFHPVRHFWRMRIDMTEPEPPPIPRWPEGITMRECVRGQDERTIFDTLEEAFQDHWGHVPRDYDVWLERSVHVDSFDPTLWFLALDGAEPAGALRGKVMADGSGWVNTLGVRRPWRRRGLGSALLLHAFGVFHRRGITSVALGVDAQNPTGATHVYEAAGMRVVREFVVQEKVLRADAAHVDEHEPLRQENVS